MNPSDWGIEPGYRDVRGRWCETSSETEAALLDAMRAGNSGPPPTPVRFARVGTRVSVGPVELHTEDGGAETLDDLLPPDLPPGYHRLIDRETGRATTLIASPGRCYLPADLREWGWAVQTYALRSNESWGIGDFGDLSRCARWAAESGAGVILVNPFHAADPYPLEDSPYYPGSRCWRNPLYLRIEDVPGASEAAADIDPLAADARRLNSDRLIDRERVHRLKSDALGHLWRRFTGSPEFDRYCAREGSALVKFATFIALAEKLGDSWRRWPAELRGANSPSVARAGEDNLERVRYHMWVQWLLDQQFEAAGSYARVINDLAVGINPEGADAWLFSESLAEGVTIGAPPDDFNLRGQGWGLAAFDPWRLRTQSYEPFIRTIRASLKHSGGLRYDHVMGLFRLFWIPEGAEPADGAYVRYPYSDLLDILALESQRAAAVTIGEDLGTVETLVREELQDRNVLSYRLMYFENDAPGDYPQCALAAITNHDLPTLPGLLSGADLEEQRRVGLVPNEEFAESASRHARDIAGADAGTPIEKVVAGCYGEIAASPSRLVVAMLEDALGVVERPNLPGTTSERPNWRLALPISIEEIESHRNINELVQLMEAGRSA